MWPRFDAEQIRRTASYEFARTALDARQAPERAGGNLALRREIVPVYNVGRSASPPFIVRGWNTIDLPSGAGGSVVRSVSFGFDSDFRRLIETAFINGLRAYGYRSLSADTGMAIPVVAATTNASEGINWQNARTLPPITPLAEDLSYTPLSASVRLPTPYAFTESPVNQGLVFRVLYPDNSGGLQMLFDWEIEYNLLEPPAAPKDVLLGRYR